MLNTIYSYTYNMFKIDLHHYLVDEQKCLALTLVTYFNIHRTTLCCMNISLFSVIMYQNLFV